MGARRVGWGLSLILFNHLLTISSVTPHIFTMRRHYAPPGRRGPELPIAADAASGRTG